MFAILAIRKNATVSEEGRVPRFACRTVPGGMSAIAPASRTAPGENAGPGRFARNPVGNVPILVLARSIRACALTGYVTTYAAHNAVGGNAARILYAAIAAATA